MTQKKIGCRKLQREGRLAYTREGGHSKNRIVFHKDITGREITSKLLDKVIFLKHAHAALRKVRVAQLDIRLGYDGDFDIARQLQCAVLERIRAFKRARLPILPFKQNKIALGISQGRNNPRCHLDL